MRTPIAGLQNAWFDSENVDDSDLTLEQNYNNLIESGIINNHFGSGVLPNALAQNVLFNSTLTSGLLDGKALSFQAQPSDTNYGNQLQVVLSGSLAAGNRTVKVLIIGLDFQNNLQYDTFTFHTNEAQVTRNHYRAVLTLLLNDFVGQQTQSLNLGGTLVIQETLSFSMSRDCLMISQNVQPNLFFRDFFVSSGGTLSNVLSAALPSYNINSLNIMTGYLQLRSLSDDVSQIGQKFLATTNNIQKITLLMSIVNDVTPTNLTWSGYLNVNLYPLQTTVACSTDITPNLAIDFDPSNIPIVQLSFSYNDFLNNGIVLSSVPQPVDFIFSSTAAATGVAITPNNYYAVTTMRAGISNTDNTQLQFAVGTNSATDTIETLFNGSIWTDVPEEAIWFEIWTDAAKVSDGQAYDNGNGMIIPKTEINPTTQLTVDYSLDQIQFVRNDVYYALAQATIQESEPVQDDRTGNTVLSQKQYVPTIALYNQLGLSNIQNVSDPLIIGTISDENVKSVNSTPLLYNFHEYGMIDNQLVIKVITDTTDGYRYDTGIIELLSELVEGNLISATIVPNTAAPNTAFKIVKSELITMIYGDVNGDGVVDENDLTAIQNVMGYNLNYMPTYAQYITNTTYFIGATSIAWSVVNPVGMITVASGTDGYLTPNPLDGTMANFGSLSANFASIVGIGTYNLVISGQVSNPGNNGTFTITALLNNHDLTIQKQYFTSDKILEIFRADIDGNMMITANDGYLLTNYVTLAPPFPPTTAPSNKIGTEFQAIRLTVEELVDRNDDYPNNLVNRATQLHALPDIFLDGYTGFAGQDLTTTPLNFSITEKLAWQDYSVISNSNPRFVACDFTNQSANVIAPCSIEGIVYQPFPQPPAFNPGRNDFFVPNNLIMNFGGQIVNPDGYYYKVDFETATITFEIPDINFNGEQTVNLLTDFVANYTGTGYTRIGYSAMRFADCSFVSMEGLLNNQVMFSVALQSFSPQLNGIDPTCLDGIIVDGKIGVSITGGVLTLNFSNLYQDPIKQTLNTKVMITVFLKKGGFNNQPIFIDSARTQNLLGIPTPDGYMGSCPSPTIIIGA